MIAYNLVPLIVSVFNFIYYLFEDQITVLCFPCNTLQDEDANKQSQGLMVVSYITIQNWRQKVIFTFAYNLDVSVIVVISHFNLTIRAA